ncbi:hypothetical protein BGZ73_004190 [Actinomortierella ambigua]|nr:hypothetical protein BGZ73_004190 [Actinomortierella ambigua]
MVSATPIDPTVFSKWTEEIEKARKNIGIHGTSVAVVYKGEIIYAKGFGKRNDTDPFTPETLAPIASITKGFTAAAIGELVAQKKAKWDAPVNQYLPEFQVKDPRLTSEITFIDMLAHRTGLPDLDVEWYQRTEPRLDLIKMLKHVEAQAPLRTEWIYNNVIFAVAGEAAARIAGKPYEDLVLETVTRPLGMTETGFSIKEMATRPNYALPYDCKNFEAAQKESTYRLPLDMSYMADAPAGALFSNVLEMANWTKAIMHAGELDGKQVLDKDSMENLSTAYSIMDQKPIKPEFGIGAYGLGLMIGSYKGHYIYHHSGGLIGYCSNIVLFPNDDLAVINLSNNSTNKLPIWLPYYIADDILNLPKTHDWLFDVAPESTKKLYKESGKEDFADIEEEFPPQIKGKSATRDLVDFEGEYTHPVAGSIKFKLEKKKKSMGTDDGEEVDALAFEWLDFHGFLDHYHFDTFRLRVDDIKAKASFLLSFVTGTDGSVQHCSLLRGESPLVYAKVQKGSSTIAKE